MIDLHLHTTASDGLLIAARARRACRGCRPDHHRASPTTTPSAASPKRATPAPRFGVRVVAGIEITAVENGRDVHILGYFLDPRSAALDRLPDARSGPTGSGASARSARGSAELGYPVDVEPLLAAAARGSRSIGRPAIADALVAGRALCRSQRRVRAPPRPRLSRRSFRAPARPPPAVVDIIHEAHGIASLAHPGIAARRRADRAAGGRRARCDRGLAQRSLGRAAGSTTASWRIGSGLAKSGGSDYHGDGVHRACRLGGVVLPAAELARLEALAARRDDRERSRPRDPRRQQEATAGCVRCAFAS